MRRQDREEEKTRVTEPLVVEHKWTHDEKGEGTGPEALVSSSGLIVNAWTRGVQFEEEALKQVLNMAKMPFVKGLAIMPDVHWGMGATVGSVTAVRGAVIPAAVGVDIGCGMMAVKTPLKASDLPDNLLTLRTAIERAVPHGRTANGGPGDRGAWGNSPAVVDSILCLEGDGKKSLHYRYGAIMAKHPKVIHQGVEKHCGTLGTGNHFIEICLDEDQAVWAVLHSGSRGPGNKIGTYFIEKAKEEMERWFINLPDKDLAYLPEGSALYNDYIEAVSWAQDYAMTNRQVMMDAVIGQLRYYFPEKMGEGTEFPTVINCHHNYVAMEHHLRQDVLVTRKGAVRAGLNDMGIIPGSMGARTYIVHGLGNPYSFESCSHGAGRRMSRNMARKTFTIDDHKKATEGVECRKDVDVIDETPGAYKDIDHVMEAQKDLVEVVHTLKQVLCVKG